jgi:tRNA(Arg) A34 adenosine deaminase TadA
LRFDELNHETYMREALREAESALSRGDLPIGAVVVYDGEIIARGANRYHSERSEISHAELNALRASFPFLFGRLERGRHPRCVVYTTVEPCPMCLGAIVMADIPNVVFGQADPNAGAAAMIEHLPYVRRHIENIVGGVLAAESADLWRRYSDPRPDPNPKRSEGEPSR